MANGKPKGQGHLDRRDDEHERQHRGLLLYAMMRPRDRSMRAVARALGAGDRTVRTWGKGKQWKLRVRWSTDPEHEAAAVYAHDYGAEYAKTDIPDLMHRISVSLVEVPGVPDKPPKRPRRKTTRKPASERRPQKGNRLTADEQVAALQADDRAREAKRIVAMRREHGDLLDAALGYIVQELDKNRVRVTLRDALAVLEMREALAAREQGPAEGKAAPPVESERLRQARDAGSSFAKALHEDAMELAAITGALVAMEERAEEVVTGSTTTATTEAATAEAG